MSSGAMVFYSDHLVYAHFCEKNYWPATILLTNETGFIDTLSSECVINCGVIFPRILPVCGGLWEE